MARLGVCYYPEHWPEDMWADDAARMIESGITLVRIGEFAWSRIEPRENKYQWEWLDRAMDTLADAGLKIILGTPTATPPQWVVKKHPDMTAHDAEGRPRGFGSRRHYCFSHTGYRKECARIVTAMAERYGKHPALYAWQTDNEYGCHETSRSYSPAARTAFQAWLKHKYTHIDTLNTAWGNVFWSMEYDGFEDIGLPNLTVTEANPSHRMDFYRFTSDEIVSFNRLQTDILRARSDVPVLHNYMGRITDFDHFHVGADLEIATWDSYPLGFLEDRSDRDPEFKARFRRQGDPDFQAFHHDLYRAVGRGRWGVMEQQPGPVNWAPYNPAPLPGMVRLWTWEAIAHGAEFVAYFRWRQAPFAQEQMHAGLLAPDNQKAPGLEEAQQVFAELDRINDVQSDDAEVAIIFDYASAWAWDIQPQGQAFNYIRLIFDIYSTLRRQGLNVDILSVDCDNFGDRQLVFIPGLFTWTTALRQAVKSAKGRVVIGPRAGSKTPDFQIPAGMPPDLADLPISVRAVESLAPDAPVPLSEGGQAIIWREFIETDAEVFALSQDGHPAAVRHGHMDYWALWPDSEILNKWITALCDKQDISRETLPEGVRIRTLGEHKIILNYNACPVSYKGETLPAAGIMIR